MPITGLTRLAGALGLIILVIAALSAPLLYPPLTAILDPIHGVAGSGASGLPSGVIRVKGVPGEAVVIWDSEGVPHIFATTDEAGVYAMGYVMASIRLFQMDLLRRVPQGNLSELVGEAGLDNDKLMRTLGIHDAIKESWELLRGSNDPELVRLVTLVEFFARGVNDRISELDSRLLPPEYRLLGLRPEPWRPEDVIASQKLFTMMLAWSTDDLVLGELVRRRGPGIIQVLDVVERRLTTPQALCNVTEKWGDATGVKMDGGIPSTSLVEVEKLDIPSAGEILKAIGEAFPLSYSMASNNWVVGPRYTVNGKPIVANDPHLALTAPSLWMLVHMETPSYRVAGVTIAGMPLVVIGRNENIAWGFTNVVGDFADFYYYKWDGDRYLYKGSWLDARVRVEVIKVWDPISRKFKEVEHRVLETVHGPVLEAKGERYAVAFTGSQLSLETAFLDRINRAGNVIEALKAQRYFTAPIQNLVVGDVHGNIAYSPVGAYPHRVNLPVYDIGGVKVVSRGFLPYNGSSGEGEWDGFISYSELPILFNPPKPFIVTANSKPFDGECGLHIGWNWADRFRQDRIVELLQDTLKTKGLISLEDVMRIQVDKSEDLSLATYAMLLVNLTERTGVYRELVESLKRWLHEGAPTSPDRWEPSLALTWALIFHRSLWANLYGSEENAGFLRIEHAESLIRSYLEGDQRAYRYLQVGEAEDIAIESLERALETLRSYYGVEDHRNWVYEKFLYYNPQHLVIKAYSYDNIGTSGGPNSVNSAPPAEIGEKGAPVRAGASVRLVSDMASNKLYVALPGGSNGNPYSEFYQNHYMKYWAKNEYYIIELGVKPTPIEELTIKGD